MFQEASIHDDRDDIRIGASRTTEHLRNVEKVRLDTRILSELQRITEGFHGIKTATSAPVKHRIERIEAADQARNVASIMFQAALPGVHAMNYLELVPVPPKSTFNLGLTSPSNVYMLELFGHPVKNAAYRADGKCTAPNNPAFTSRIVTASVGPFRVTGLRPAVDSLREIMTRVRVEIPELHALLGSSGMLCSRFTKIRKPGGMKIGPGISNHSWGAALDINLGGALDAQGNNRTQRGLLILSTYFNAAGWYWGAAFPTEDAMHFEASRSLLARWRTAGEL